MDLDSDVEKNAILEAILRERRKGSSDLALLFEADNPYASRVMERIKHVPASEDDITVALSNLAIAFEQWRSFWRSFDG
jgi:hypothetical protein